MLAEPRQKSRVAEHGVFHQRVAGANCNAMPAGNAARFADRRAAIPQYARIWVFPTDRQSFIDLKVLARFDAAAAQDALIGIVTVERIARIDLVRLGLKRVVLMRYSEQFGRVMNGAVAVVVVADRAV